MNYPSIRKGANLTIYVLLSELRVRRQSHNGENPQVLYLQVDKGSENANKYVLACLEYLVAIRMICTIFYTRMTTGHIHDIYTEIGLLHRQSHTQYQWNFEAVTVRSLFPLRVKSTYRAYCSDKAVEIEQLPNEQFVSVAG